MSNVEFSGILKLKLSDEQISFIEQLELPPEAIRLKRKYLHVTLIHQSFLKPFRAELKNRSKDYWSIFAPANIVFANGVSTNKNESSFAVTTCGDKYVSIAEFTRLNVRDNCFF